MEAQAFSLEAAFWGSYWGRSPRPVRTDRERQLGQLVDLLITRGDPGFYEYVVENPGYQANCDLMVPTTAVQPQPLPVAAPRPTPLPAPPPPPPGPTPMQTARCRQDALDIATTLAPYAKNGKSAAAALDSLFNWCQQAATDKGDVGLYCFEAANRQFIVGLQSGYPPMEPTQYYRYCVSR
jgi:hypothetical protein